MLTLKTVKKKHREIPPPASCVSVGVIIVLLESSYPYPKNHKEYKTQYFLSPGCRVKSFYIKSL